MELQINAYPFARAGNLRVQDKTGYVGIETGIPSNILTLCQYACDGIANNTTHAIADG
jgi:hypothetical protein